MAPSFLSAEFPLAFADPIEGIVIPPASSSEYLDFLLFSWEILDWAMAWMENVSIYYGIAISP